MTRYLLDTNIVSNATKPSPSPSLLGWMAIQRDEDLFIAAYTLGEIWRGVRKRPPGRKQRELETWFTGPDGPRTLFMGRVLPFDDRAALVWGDLMTDDTARRQPRSAVDMIIAAVAVANGCIIVTDNERDFHGLDVLNPMRR